MYYLVKDENSESKKIFSSKDDIEEYEEEGSMLAVYNWEEGQYSDTRDGKRIYFDQYYILKKSKSVYDLIEIGDLVRIYSTFFRRIDSLGLQKMHNLVGIEREFFPENEISEIYKPNEKGDFIKVWTREDE